MGQVCEQQQPGAVLDVLEDRAAAQRGPAGWSYKPAGLMLLSTDKCKVLHLGQKEHRLGLSEQAAALQEWTPGAGGQVIHEEPEHLWGHGESILGL